MPFSYSIPLFTRCTATIQFKQKLNFIIGPIIYTALQQALTRVGKDPNIQREAAVTRGKERRQRRREAAEAERRRQEEAELLARRQQELEEEKRVTVVLRFFEKREHN